MHMSPVSRAAALALAALFLGGVGGASDLDAVLFHGTGTAVTTGVAHVETAGNPGCHAERCVLALRLASGRVAHMPAMPVRFEGIPQHAAGARPISPPCRPPSDHQQQSRAPPASIA